MSVFKDKKLVKRDGTEVDATEAVNAANIVLCYFSAHWCPPCRGFTPELKKFYEKVEADGKKVVIIFVSSDQDENKMKSYFNEHGDYLAVPFPMKELSQALKTNCSVSGIPALCVVDKDGKSKYNACRGDVTSKTPEECYNEWMAIMQS